MYVKCDPEEVKTLGGILLPGSAARKPTSGSVVELGDGRVGQKDDYKFTVKKGDSVSLKLTPFLYFDDLFRCFIVNSGLRIPNSLTSKKTTSSSGKMRS